MALESCAVIASGNHFSVNAIRASCGMLDCSLAGGGTQTCGGGGGMLAGGCANGCWLAGHCGDGEVLAGGAGVTKPVIDIHGAFATLRSTLTVAPRGWIRLLA